MVTNESEQGRFQLHPVLERDTVRIASWQLSEVLLMKDANYPWLILVPRVTDITEIYQLDEADQKQLLRESSLLGQQIMSGFNGHKLNVAALGNMVPQLHLHHIVRFENDPAWPGPIWGKVPVKNYQDEELASMVDKVSRMIVR
ncbi:MAG: hypothetical protein CSB48_13490 [Proteobacteria bacterium]|nr:MAG: hypothetical protein CSB48_13490 [Pseudomonadota bacterium]